MLMGNSKNCKVDFFQLTIDFLGRIMCLDLTPFRKRSANKGNNPGSAEEARRLLNSSTPQHTKYAVVNLNNSKNRRNSFDHNLVSATDSNGFLQQGDMTKVAGSLRDMAATIVNNAKREQARRELRAEWQAVTKVLDRLFFYSYVIAIVFSLAFMFPRPE